LREEEGQKDGDVRRRGKNLQRERKEEKQGLPNPLKGGGLERPRKENGYARKIL